MIGWLFCLFFFLFSTIVYYPSAITPHPQATSTLALRRPLIAAPGEVATTWARRRLITGSPRRRKTTSDTNILPLKMAKTWPIEHLFISQQWHMALLSLYCPCTALLPSIFFWLLFLQNLTTIFFSWSFFFSISDSSIAHT